MPQIDEQELNSVLTQLADASEKIAGVVRLLEAVRDRTPPMGVEPPISLIEELSTNPNAKYPFPNWNRSLSQIRWMTIHHSSGSRATQNIEWWHRFHTQSKSWSRVGYHFGIAARHSGGEIRLHQMNSLQTFSWHDGRNQDSFAVCFAGDLRQGHDERPNDVQLDCFGRLVAWLLEKNTLPEWSAIVGHKRFGSTACPGDIHIWYEDLIDAARQHGHDISGMIDLGTESLAARTFAVVTEVAKTPAFWRKSPSLSDYDEHSGLDVVEGR